MRKVFIADMGIRDIAIYFSTVSRQRVEQIVRCYEALDDIDTLWKIGEAKKLLKKARHDRKYGVVS